MIIIWQGRQTPVDQYGILDWRISQNQSGSVTINGTIAATAPNASGTLQGTVKVQGTLAATAQPANSNLTGKVLVKGALGPTAPNATSVLQGTVQSNTRAGQIIATAPNATSDLEGASGTTGGLIKRRHSKRYEFQVANGPILIAPSIAALQQKIAAWRAAHPQSPAIQQPQVEMEVVPHTQAGPRADNDGATEPSASGEAAQSRLGDQEAPSNTVPGAPFIPGEHIAIGTALAQQAARAEQQQAAEALMLALQTEEDDDMEALRMILEIAA